MAHIEITPALFILPLLLFTIVPHSQTNIIRSQPMELDVEERLMRDERDVQLDKPPLTLQLVEDNLDAIDDSRKSEERKDAASGGSIPFLPTSNAEPNKEGGSIPFIPGGSIPEIPGMQALEGQMTNVPKLVWGGFFFVETPMPGASLSNLGSIMSVMQNGQQMVPSQFTNGLIPQAPAAG